MLIFYPRLPNGNILWSCDKCDNVAEVSSSDTNAVALYCMCSRETHPRCNADWYNKNLYIYDLYAICNHGGSVMGGHYTATIKNSNNKWYVFNDTSILPISQIEKNEKPYCFFYRKKKLLNNI